MNKVICLLIVFIIMLNLSLAITSTRSVEVIETKNLSFYFTKINNINGFGKARYQNLGFLNNTYPLGDNGTKIETNDYYVEGPIALSGTDFEVAFQLSRLRFYILTSAILSKLTFTNAIGIVEDGYLDRVDSTGYNLGKIGQSNVILIEKSQTLYL